MKLSQLLKAWDILHVMDVGEVGFCDLDNALTEAGVIIENDCSPCQPVLQQADSADGEKLASEIQEACQNGASVSDIMQILAADLNVRVNKCTTKKM